MKTTRAIRAKRQPFKKLNRGRVSAVIRDHIEAHAPAERLLDELIVENLTHSVRGAALTDQIDRLEALAVVEGPEDSLTGARVREETRLVADLTVSGCC